MNSERYDPQDGHTDSKQQIVSKFDFRTGRHNVYHSTSLVFGMFGSRTARHTVRTPRSRGELPLAAVFAARS